MDLRISGKVLGGLLSAVMLTACTDNSGDSAQSSQQVQPLFMLSADGVGPLNADTPFNLKQIGEAFQNYNVAQETHFLRGAKYPMITVKQRANPLLSINPDHKQNKVFSIVAHDNLIGNKLGHRIGDRFNEIYAYGKTEECGPGLEEWLGKVMCYAPHTGNILYLFADGSSVDNAVAGADGEIDEEVNGEADGQASGENQVPPPEEMTDWVLEAIVWKPPGR